MKHLQIIQEFFNKELTTNLKNILIIDNNEGGYDLFGKYRIVRADDEKFLVKRKNKVDHVSFYTLAHAVTWCIYDKNKRFWELKKIQELDETLNNIDFIISVQKNLLVKTNDTSKKHIYLNKFNEAKIKRKLVQNQMQNYILMSKYWQNKTFEEAEPKISFTNDKYHNKNWN